VILPQNLNGGFLLEEPTVEDDSDDDATDESEADGTEASDDE